MHHSPLISAFSNHSNLQSNKKKRTRKAGIKRIFVSFNRHQPTHYQRADSISAFLTRCTIIEARYKGRPCNQRYYEECNIVSNVNRNDCNALRKIK